MDKTKIKITVESLISKNNGKTWTVNTGYREPVKIYEKDSCCQLDQDGFIVVSAWNSGEMQHVYTEQDIRSKLYMREK